MTSDAVERFVAALVERVPALAGLYEDHLDYYEELLPTLLFGDVARHLYAACEGDTPEAWAEIDATLAFCEQEWTAGDDDVQTVIFTGLLENLVEAPESCPTLVRRLPLNLRREFATLFVATEPIDPDLLLQPPDPGE